MRFFLALLLCGNLAHGAKVLPELNVPLPDLRVTPGASGSGIGVGPASPKATQSAQGGLPQPPGASRRGQSKSIKISLSQLSFRSGMLKHGTKFTNRAGELVYNVINRSNYRQLFSRPLMMKNKSIQLALILSVLGFAGMAQAKPLKVYILAGQSNMEGHAQTRTFPAIAKDPETKYLYDKIVGPDGEPRVHDNIWINYSYGNFPGDPVGKREGKLTAGYGSQHHIGTGKIGPELTFGITMQEHLGEPILLIKNAWGGKSLMVDFRPPSAGELDDPKLREKAGRYYQLTIEHVKEVLAGIKGDYELAGFIWFQGFNDMVGNYPRVDPAKGKRSVKDYSEYSRLLSCFIRDVRQDLQAPELPFVVGVLGVGGKDVSENAQAFHQGMAAPALTDEFRGNVINVHSADYWPSEIDAVQLKVSEVKKTFSALKREAKNLEGTARRQAEAKLNEEERAAIEAALTADELFTLEMGVSNQSFHYYGSAKFFARLGEAFAKSLIQLKNGS